MDTALASAHGADHVSPAHTTADQCQALWQQLQQLVQSREAGLSARELVVQQQAQKHQQLEQLLVSLSQHIQAYSSNGQARHGQQQEQLAVQLLQDLLQQTVVLNARMLSNQQPSSAIAYATDAVTPIKDLAQRAQRKQPASIYDGHERAAQGSQPAQATPAAPAQGALALLHQQQSLEPPATSPSSDSKQFKQQQRIYTKLCHLGGKLRQEHQQLQQLQQQMAEDLNQAQEFASFLQGNAETAARFAAWRQQQGLAGADAQPPQPQQQVLQCQACGAMQLQPAGTSAPAAAAAGTFEAADVQHAAAEANPGVAAVAKALAAPPVGKKKKRKRKNPELQTQQQLQQQSQQQQQQQQGVLSKPSKKQKSLKQQQQQRQQQTATPGGVQQPGRDTVGPAPAAVGGSPHLMPSKACQKSDPQSSSPVAIPARSASDARASPPAHGAPTAAAAAAAANGQVQDHSPAADEVLGMLYELQEKHGDTDGPAASVSAARQQSPPSPNPQQVSAPTLAPIQLPAACAQDAPTDTQQTPQQQRHSTPTPRRITPTRVLPAVAAATADDRTAQTQPESPMQFRGPPLEDVTTVKAGAQGNACVDAGAAQNVATRQSPQQLSAGAKAAQKPHMFRPNVPRARRPSATEDQSVSPATARAEQTAAASCDLAASPAAAVVQDAVAAAGISADDEPDPYEHMDPEMRVAALGKRGASPGNVHAAEEKRRRHKQLFVHGPNRTPIGSESDSAAHQAGSTKPQGQQQQEQQPLQLQSDLQQQSHGNGAQADMSGQARPKPVADLQEQGLQQQTVVQVPDESGLAQQRQQQHEQFLKQFSHFGQQQQQQQPSAGSRLQQKQQQQQARQQQQQQQQQIPGLDLPAKPWLQPLQQQQRQQHEHFVPKQQQQQQQQQQQRPQQYNPQHNCQQQQRSMHRKPGGYQQQQQHTQQHYNGAYHHQDQQQQQQQGKGPPAWKHHPTKHVLPVGAAAALNSRRHHAHPGGQQFGGQHPATAASAANGHYHGGGGGGMGGYRGSSGSSRPKEEDASEQELAAMVEELRQAAG